MFSALRISAQEISAAIELVQDNPPQLPLSPESEHEIAKRESFNETLDALEKSYEQWRAEERPWSLFVHMSKYLTIDSFNCPMV